MFEKKALQPTVSQSLGHCWMSNLCPEKVDPIVLHDLGRFSHQFHWLKHGKIYPRKCVLDIFFLQKQRYFLKTTMFFFFKWSNCKVSRCKFGVSLHQTYIKLTHCCFQKSTCHFFKNTVVLKKKTISPKKMYFWEKNVKHTLPWIDFSMFKPMKLMAEAPQVMQNNWINFFRA